MKTLTKITMAVLLITLIISVTFIYAASSPDQNVTTFNSENGVTIRIPENITTMFDRTGTVTPDIWTKYIGGDVSDSDDVPDIIDYSYAGYKYGEEAIPDIANSEWTVRNAIDYGAIPNDMKSDTEALRRFFSDVPSNTILYIPVGRYDINMASDARNYRISATFDHPNVIIRGAGAEGYKRGGTSIYMHEKPVDANGVPNRYTSSIDFRANRRTAPSSGQTTVTGFHEAGAMSFTVANGSTYSAGDFIQLEQISLFTEDTPENSKIFQFNVGLPHSTTSSYYASNIANGLPLNEKHEIDRVEGNTVYIKDPLMTPINNNIKIKGITLVENIGIEDIHFDFGQNGRYSHMTNHDVGHGREGIGLSSLAHSWVKHVRVSNAMSTLWITSCHAVSVTGIILENTLHPKQAHYGGTIGSSSRIFVGLFEEITEVPATGKIDGSFHGFTVSARSAGTVLWGLGIKLGVDFHGGQPRHNLIDNYRGWDHDSSSGGGVPHHLAGYVNWNSESQKNTHAFNLQAWTHKFTRAISVGYKDRANSTPYNGSVESYGSTVNPVSLYVGQLTHRLGYEPAWIQSEISEYNTWRESLLWSTPYVAPPTITSHTAGIHNIKILVNQSPSEKVGVSIRAVNLSETKESLTFELIGDDAHYFEIRNVSGSDDHEVYTADLHVSSLFAPDTREAFYPVVKIENTTGYSVTQYLKIQIDYFIPIADRTPQVRDAIYSHFRKDLRPITKEHISDFRGLNVANKGLTSLKSGDFYGLGSITSLALDDNSLESLPADIFRGLDNLRILQLGNNNISSLPEGVFDGLTELFRLTMGHNKLTALPDNLCADLSSLDRMEFNHNKITRIQKDLLLQVRYI